MKIYQYTKNTKHKPASFTSVKSSDRDLWSLVHLFFPPPNPILPYSPHFPTLFISDAPFSSSALHFLSTFHHFTC